jgi:hypothetical protein
VILSRDRSSLRPEGAMKRVVFLIAFILTAVN